MLGDREYADDREGLAHVHIGIAEVDNWRVPDLNLLVSQFCSRNENRTLVKDSVQDFKGGHTMNLLTSLGSSGGQRLTINRFLSWLVTVMASPSD